MKKKSEIETKDNDRFEKELELWRKCASGDDCAREELILSYRPMVYWLAKKIKVPYSIYSDLIQEGMVALINSVDSFEIARSNRFSTFAYYKIRGRMINYLQRVEAKAPLPVDDSELPEEEICSLTPQTAAETDRSEWAMDIESAMATLSERESDVIRALIIEGRRAKDIADQKKLDVSHIYRIRRRALEKLRRWLGKTDDATSAM